MSQPPAESVASNGSQQPTEKRESTDSADLQGRIEQLAAENRRLRRAVGEASKQQYRSTAIGLVTVGVICGLLGVATPGGDVLFALSGIGLFCGVLTYYLTPNRVIPATVSERLYTATAGSYEEICQDLGLSDRRLYVPIPTAEGESNTDQDAVVRLFVPQQSSAALPPVEQLTDGAFIVDETGTHGLSVQPTGGTLFDAFSAVLSEPLAETPQALYEQLSDAVVEDFELARSVTADIDPDDGRLSVRFVEPLYNSHRQFDHPLVSFVAVGLAVGLDVPVETTITNTDPLSVTFRWETAAEHGRQPPTRTTADAVNES